jgi:hypothetical protein
MRSPSPHLTSQCKTATEGEGSRQDSGDMGGSSSLVQNLASCLVFQLPIVLLSLLPMLQKRDLLVPAHSTQQYRAMITISRNYAINIDLDGSRGRGCRSPPCRPRTCSELGQEWEVTRCEASITKAKGPKVWSLLHQASSRKRTDSKQLAITI